MDKKNTNDVQQDEADDFASVLDDCSKDLDKKLNLNEQTAAQSQTQQSIPKPADAHNINSVFADLGLGGNIDFSQMPMEDNEMADAQKMFQDMMKGMGGLQQENPNMENPFLLACNQMFKDFEQISKEEQQPKPQQQNQAPPTGGMPEMPDMNDPNFMNLLNSFAKDLLSGDGQQSDKAMENLMNEFTSFLKDSEGSEEMKTALESVVQEIINKDTLYEPMKTLKDAFPQWLETNWQKVSSDDLERYNKQLDKITEICKYYEENTDPDNAKAFELLGQLQELGSPPEELMKKIASSQFGQGGSNPFTKI